MTAARWVAASDGSEHLVTGEGGVVDESANRIFESLCGVVVSERQRRGHCPACSQRARQDGVSVEGD